MTLPCERQEEDFLNRNDYASGAFSVKDVKNAVSELQYLLRRSVSPTTFQYLHAVRGRHRATQLADSEVAAGKQVEQALLLACRLAELQSLLLLLLQTQEHHLGDHHLERSCDHRELLWPGLAAAGLL